MATTISYTPESHEGAYYEGLFQAADIQRSNNIGGQQAVQFFTRSKLPIDVLKNIWTVADQPSTSSLDRQKFAVAIRLIQLAQNGTKGQGTNLAVPHGVTLRPAFLEGVSGVTIPLPPTNATAGPGASVGAPPSYPTSPVSTRSAMTAMTGPPHGSMQMMPTPGSQRTSLTVPQPGTLVGNNAMVPQDPYAMTPQERGRYEELFPQYAKPDGFMYGGEAVALFMKSGVDQQVLRGLWNIVDDPVDNRLDRLEFAIAMHLIVCISKKNLPPPQGQLPPSLRALKVPPTPSLPPRPEMPQQQAIGMPPPQLGGMSISDAFDGLSVDNAPEDPYAAIGAVPQQEAPVEPPSLPSYVPAEEQQQPESTTATMAVATVAPEQPSMMTHLEQTIEPPAPVEQPKIASLPAASTEELASPYQMGEASDELAKLQGVLQKLQAENISLKAQLGSMTEEEKNVQKELSATISEIGILSNTLQTSRQEVLDAKTNLIELSATLKAAKAQKGVLTSLIGEATETKVAINEATNSIQNIASAVVAQEQHDAALQKSETFENNLFGYNVGIPEPTPESQQPTNNRLPSASFDSTPGTTTPLSFSAPNEVLPEPNRAPTMSFDSSTLPPGVAGSTSVDVSLFNQPPSSPQQAVFPDIPLVMTVSSEDELQQDQQQGTIDNAPEMFENPALAVDARGPSPIPPPQQQAPPQSFGIPTPQLTPQYPPPQQSVAATPVPQQQYQYPVQPSPIPTPQFGLARPNALSVHARMESVGGFGSDMVMGGSAEKLPPDTNVYSAADGATASVTGGASQEDLKYVEELKRKARMAQETANDAATAHRTLAAQADELRGDADRAEANARSLRAAAEEKKKGRFGNKKKKQMSRDAENAAEDASEIRKRFMAVQAQSQDAQAVSMETKREAERLKEDAEKAELEVAAKASIQEQQRVEQEKLQVQRAGAAPNGYPPQQAYKAYGQAPPQQQAYAGYEQQPYAGHAQQPNAGYAQQTHPGYAQQPPPQQYTMPPSQAGSEFAGGGGFAGIPAPQQGGSDPYANPF